MIKRSFDGGLVSCQWIMGHKRSLRAMTRGQFGAIGFVGHSRPCRISVVIWTSCVGMTKPPISSSQVKHLHNEHSLPCKSALHLVEAPFSPEIGRLDNSPHNFMHRKR